MKCPQCRTEVASDSHFCPRCGTKIAGPGDGAWLDTAVREHDSVLSVMNVYTEYLVPELAGDPRFGALLDRLKLPR